MADLQPVKPSFSPEYARYLGMKDGIELGHKNPSRSFYQDSADERSIAYFQGLDAGVQQSNRDGLDMRCLVHWDNPGFDTPQCGKRASYIGIAQYNTSTHVIPLCERHARQAEHCNAKVGSPDGFPKQWAILPIAWV